MTRYNLFIATLILFFCFSCHVSTKLEPDKDDPFQNKMREMNDQFDGIYIFFEKGYSNSSISIASGNVVLVDTVVTTQNTSQLAYNIPLSFGKLENPRKLHCSVDGKRFNIIIDKDYQNIRVSIVQEKRGIILVYDNNYNLYE